MIRTTSSMERRRDRRDSEAVSLLRGKRQTLKSSRLLTLLFYTACRTWTYKRERSGTPWPEYSEALQLRAFISWRDRVSTLGSTCSRLLSAGPMRPLPETLLDSIRGISADHPTNDFSKSPGKGQTLARQPNINILAVRDEAGTRRNTAASMTCARSQISAYSGASPDSRQPERPPDLWRSRRENILAHSDVTDDASTTLRHAMNLALLTSQPSSKAVRALSRWRGEHPVLRRRRK